MKIGVSSIKYRSKERIGVRLNRTDTNSLLVLKRIIVIPEFTAVDGQHRTQHVATVEQLRFDLHRGEKEVRALRVLAVNGKSLLAHVGEILVHGFPVLVPGHRVEV